MASPSANLRAIGFCGVDDSVSPQLLRILSDKYPWVEWAVLFRTDLEGQPRYPTWAWVETLSSLCLEAGEAPKMRLAGHLCADRCQEVLEGKSAFVLQLHALGYRRVQVNATAANSVSVDPSRLAEYAQNIRNCMLDAPEVEFIIQCNAETQPIYQQLLDAPEPNMSILYDASCGKGVRVSSFPSPALFPIPCGYAGGIGPDCIADILAGVAAATASCPDQPVWIDMESSLRTVVVEKQGGQGQVQEVAQGRVLDRQGIRLHTGGHQVRHEL
eukprot:CAMPEP_0173175806 /NCGR_PEP_ID=MMETSP1141-20130122/4110_1 /TAXON_ID=483371 /ORGANISM="non described non described, Strain CCMP2298" /LENGTH=271 /DNA_ID=CAMNT_0014098077 /DNA_START=35 /DNA_END=846 /DNA_ORIENTATION=-